MKKIGKIFMCLALVLVVALPFAMYGCSSGEDSSLDTSDTVYISFNTQYGSLSFSQTFSEKENGDDRAYITLSDCPTISGEGDDKIFDCWTLDDGTEVDFSQGFSADTELYARFKSASLVAKASWSENQSILSKRYSVHSIRLMGSQETASNNSSIKYVKVSNEEIASQNYLTKQQIENNYANACFITSSNGTQFIKSSDLTTNTYRKEIYFVISPDDYVIRSFGFFDYQVKGVAPMGNVSGALMETVYSNYGAMPTSSNCSNPSFITYVGQNSQLTNQQSTMTSIRSSATYSASGNFSQYNNYYCFIVLSGLKFSLYGNNGVEYYRSVPNDGRIEECSESTFNATVL